jgi:hypothetical protein
VWNSASFGETWNVPAADPSLLQRSKPFGKSVLKKKILPATVKS